MPDLPYGDECRKGVADNRQTDPTIKPMRQATEFKRQGCECVPRDQAREGALRQNWHRKRMVLAVSAANGINPTVLIDINFCPSNRVIKPGDRLRQMKTRIGKHRRGNIAFAENRIAPASIGVLVFHKPVKSAQHKRL